MLINYVIKTNKLVVFLKYNLCHCVFLSDKYWWWRWRFPSCIHQQHKN